MSIEREPVVRKAEVTSDGANLYTVSLFRSDGNDWRQINEVQFIGLSANLYAYIGRYLQTGYY